MKFVFGCFCKYKDTREAIISEIRISYVSPINPRLLKKRNITFNQCPPPFLKFVKINMLLVRRTMISWKVFFLISLNNKYVLLYNSLRK